MYLLSRRIILNMCDWVEEPLAVSDLIDNLKLHKSVDSKLFVVDSINGRDHINDRGLSHYYTIQPIEVI